ncbi:peptidyl-tRNA hydrolase 2, mitochondrial-like isoform X2 [Oratosquilla oratoria]|uniref:peptidyl-tRNA hydrolase 2, mitochondrial-like isoform X2 n=1 Tax=Oratosquilla oratoria TaxID=337810 RepID=UPI003F7780C3
MIPILTNLLTQPGVLVGMGVGVCIGFVVRGSIPGEYKKNIGESEKEEWDEDGFLSAGSGQHKLVLVVRSDLKMGKGKVAAQCSHATLKAYKQVKQNQPGILRTWEMNGQPKVVVKIDNEEDLIELTATARTVGLTTSLIQDAGRTQIAPGSRTVLGVGPGPSDLVDQVTGHLKLY